MREIVHRTRGIHHFTPDQVQWIVGMLSDAFRTDGTKIMELMRTTTQYYITKRKKVVAMLSFSRRNRNRAGEEFPNMIYNVCTHPMYRERGLMKRIFQHLQKTVRGPLHLEVSQDNLPAIALYHAMGFHILKPIHRHDTPPSFMMNTQ